MGDRTVDIINKYFKENQKLYGIHFPLVSDVRINDRGTFYMLDREVLITTSIQDDLNTQLGARIGVFDFDETHKGAPRTVQYTALFFREQFDPMALPIPWGRVATAMALFALFLAVYMHFNVKKEIYDI